MRARQKAILSLFHKRRAEGRPPPTLREIVEDTDITSTSVAKYNLDVLVRKGELIWAGENIARAYRLPYGNSENSDVITRLYERIIELEDALQSVEDGWRIAADDLNKAMNTITIMQDQAIMYRERIEQLERDLLSERSKHSAWIAWGEKR